MSCTEDFFRFFILEYHTNTSIYSQAKDLNFFIFISLVLCKVRILDSLHVYTLVFFNTLFMLFHYVLIGNLVLIGTYL